MWMYKCIILLFIKKLKKFLGYYFIDVKYDSFLFWFYRFRIKKGIGEKYKREFFYCY